MSILKMTGGGRGVPERIGSRGVAWVIAITLITIDEYKELLLVMPITLITMHMPVAPTTDNTDNNEQFHDASSSYH